MGKGDKKSKKGKIFKGSYGNSRKRNTIKNKLNKTTTAKPASGVAVEAAAKPKAKRTTKKKESAE